MHPFFPIKFVAGKYLVFFFFFFLENLLSNTRLEGRSSEEIRVHVVQTGPPFLKILNLLSLTLLSFYYIIIIITTTLFHHGKHVQYTIIVLPHVRGLLKFT